MTSSLLTILLILFCSSVSPVKMGILEAKTGEERYNILYEAHVRALEKGAQVDYSGIDTLRLDIPKNAKSIPLGNKTDFKGTVFIVNNVVPGNFFLFTKTQKAEPVALKNLADIDNGDFRGYSELRSGKNMLIIEDKNPWIENRRGFNYGMNRRDILVLKNGKAQNKTCTVYDNEYTDASCSYVPISKRETTFSNVEFYRTKTSTAKTFLVKFEYQYNIIINNVMVLTPEGSGLYGDEAIFLKDCARVDMNNVTILGSYSMGDKYGYGISLDNVYDIDFDHIEGDAPWGVFGNNNVNRASLRNSHVNRFDVHCYGRDIYFKNCFFDRTGFLYSSLFGEVVFERCVFKYVFPCLNRLDFNAYSPFDLKFQDCTFQFDSKHYALVNLSDVDDIINPRHELSQKSLPNISIENCLIELDQDVSFLYLYYVGGCKYSHPLNYLSLIRMKDIIVMGEDIQMKLFNTYVDTEFQVATYFNDISRQYNLRIETPFKFVSIYPLNYSNPSKRLVYGEEYVK